MKRSLIVLLTVVFLVLSYHCNKDNATQKQPLSFVERAKVYFESQPLNPLNPSNPTNSLNQNLPSAFPPMARTALWDKASIKPNSLGQVVWVPIHYAKPFYLQTSFGGKRLFDINDMQWLVLYKDKQEQWHREIITYYPDSSTNGTSKTFTGIARIEDGEGNFIREYKYGPNGTIKMASRVAPNTRSITVCYSASGYNYMAENPSEGYYWTIDLGCDYFYIDEPMAVDITHGSDYGGGAVPSLPMVRILGGKNIIGNIQDYTKCFDNIAGSTKKYSVTVCVDQPSPGSRSPWGFDGSGSSATGSPVSVGHTFLILSESGDNGTITRNVGFYPGGTVNPASPISNGQLNNDDYHDYNISVTIAMDNSQFFTMLNFISHGNDQGYLYDLNSNNCTNFAINALGSAGIILPSTRGVWPGGKGNDPGDFGEDIRSMKLQSNMSRSTSAISHPNLGSCY